MKRIPSDDTILQLLDQLEEVPADATAPGTQGEQLRINFHSMWGIVSINIDWFD
jgi:hypothetical protein